MTLKASRSVKIWIYGTITAIALIFTTQQAADYRIYVAAGRVMVDEKANPFLAEDMVETEPDGIVTPHAQYRYAPIFGIALYPFSLLPKQVYIFLWLFFNAFLLYKSVLLFREFFSELKVDNGYSHDYTFYSLLGSEFPAWSNHHFTCFPFCLCRLFIEKK
jgi:hypothetical protein